MDLKVFKNKRALRFGIIALVFIMLFLVYLAFFLSEKATLSERMSQSFLASTESITQLESLKAYILTSRQRILSSTDYNSVDNYKFYLTYSTRIEEFTDKIKINQKSNLDTGDFETGLIKLTDDLLSHLQLIEIIYEDYADIDQQVELLTEKEEVFFNNMLQTLERVQMSLITMNAFQGTHSVTLAQVQREQISIATIVLVSVLGICAISLIYLAFVYSVAQSHLRSLYTQSEHPIITLDQDGKVTHLNHKATRLFSKNDIVRNKSHMRDLIGYQWDQIQGKLAEYQFNHSFFNKIANKFSKNRKRYDDEKIEHDLTISEKGKPNIHYKLNIIIMRTLNTYRAVIKFVDQTQLVNIEDKTQRDSFTNLTNKTGILKQLNSEIERAKRHHHALSVVFIDIDGFKGINDKYGHQFGDKVIKWVANRISNRVRETDYLGRFGGDEFVLVCPDCRANQADNIAEDIRKLLKSPKLHIKASFGVAEMDPKDTRTTLLNRADKALYRAKSSGKDMVVVSG